MKLTIICSWCSGTIGEKDCDVLDESLPRITHSICQVCSVKVLEDLKQTDNENRECWEGFPDGSPAMALYFLPFFSFCCFLAVGFLNIPM